MASILIIDDEKAIRKTLSEILSFEDYKVEEASDGEEGLRKFKEKAYDVVLCDIKMPKIDGLEFLQKATEANPDVPVIMISGHGNIETAVEAVKRVLTISFKNHQTLTAYSSPFAMQWSATAW